MPAAMSSANARYGLHAESSERISTRVEFAFPGLYIGTRTSAEGLACPQQTNVGASTSSPGAAYPNSRLYEFTHWLVTAVISRACCSSPAMKARAVFDRFSSSDGSWKAFRSPSNSDRWVCIPDPGWSVNGLGMNVAYTPWAWATSFTAYRNVITLSAVVSASA